MITGTEHCGIRKQKLCVLCMKLIINNQNIFVRHSPVKLKKYIFK